MSWSWLVNMPSTNARIAMTLFLALMTGLRVVFSGWDPPTEWLAFLFGQAFVDAGQFVGKRATFKPEVAE